MSKPRRSNPAPVTSPAAEPGTEPADEPARLHISLEAAAGVGALMQTRAAIERICPEPLRFLGPVDGRLKLNLEIADPGCCHGAEDNGAHPGQYQHGAHEGALQVQDKGRAG